MVNNVRQTILSQIYYTVVFKRMYDRKMTFIITNTRRQNESINTAPSKLALGLLFAFDSHKLRQRIKLHYAIV